MAKKELLAISLSFASLPANEAGAGEREFYALVEAHKGVVEKASALEKARKARENATTAFLKKIAAYDKGGKPTKAACNKGPAFVTSWAMQFFTSWPEVTRPGRKAEPASLANSAVKALFASEEHAALLRAYNALAAAISTVKKAAAAPAPAQEPEAQAEPEPEPAPAQEPEAQAEPEPQPASAARLGAIAAEQAALEWFERTIQEAENKPDPIAYLRYMIQTRQAELKKKAA